MDPRRDWSVTLLETCENVLSSHESQAKIRDVIAAHVDAAGFSTMRTFADGTVVRAARLPFRAEIHHLQRLRQSLAGLNLIGCDAVLLPASAHWSHFKLAVFDLDSTLITCEGIVELAEMMQIGEQVSAITESAMRGEIDFQESFRRRIALLKGLEQSRVHGLAHSVQLTSGAQLLINSLTKLGYRTAIATGGFDFIAERLRKEIGIHDYCANVLEFSDGRVTGKIPGKIIDGEGKAAFVRELAKRQGISTSEAIVIGDGANDIPMMQTAGLSVAFHAKPKVIAAATCSLKYAGLDAILYLLQIPPESLPGN